jgi:hypothetical protein
MLFQFFVFSEETGKLIYVKHFQRLWLPQHSISQTSSVLPTAMLRKMEAQEMVKDCLLCQLCVQFLIISFRNFVLTGSQSRMRRSVMDGFLQLAVLRSITRMPKLFIHVNSTPCQPTKCGGSSMFTNETNHKWQTFIFRVIFTERRGAFRISRAH